MSRDPARRAAARKWWGRRRLVYNAGLVASGMAAFCTAAMMREFARNPSPETGVTPFTLLFQVLGYMLAMGVANLCYSLGPVVERWVRPEKVEAYRHWTFGAGLAVSVMAPLGLPIVSALRGGP